MFVRIHLDQAVNIMAAAAQLNANTNLVNYSTRKYLIQTFVDNNQYIPTNRTMQLIGQK